MKLFLLSFAGFFCRLDLIKDEIIQTENGRNRKNQIELIMFLSLRKCYSFQAFALNGKIQWIQQKYTPNMNEKFSPVFL